MILFKNTILKNKKRFRINVCLLRPLFFIFIFLNILIKTNAQVPDSVRIVRGDPPLPPPSVVKAPDSIPAKKKFVPVPKKALLYSIIPGGGQIYNRKWWWLKLPIVYGALGGGGVAIQFNSSRYKYLKTAYYNKVNNLEIPKSDLFPFISNNSAGNIKQARDAYFKQLQTSYIVTGILYILSGVEAFTAAHLMNFDISDDLTMQVKPNFNTMPYGYGQTVGLGFAITLK
jgi:hypothetical protein